MKQSQCDFSLAHWAITITVLPQWAIITALIVVVLLAFHNSLRAAKIYDNCTKNNAKYKYYVEIRTGDTSYSYNRRRTTLYVDMFDDNQTTLARVAIPGHIIFGKKDSPTNAIDDEKYYELRVTRFWLYRLNKLRKVSTIRLTHTCTEQDARIMIFGVEIRTSETDISKLFFPVMNYISAYGSVNKPNSSFDIESTGSISNMGGMLADSAPVSAQMSWADLTILFYFLAALVLILTTLDITEQSFVKVPACIAKGALVGLFSYLVTLILGLLMRYFIKQNYAKRIGVGAWSYVYYGSCITIVSVATAIWVYTTVTSYKSLCPKFYSLWVLAIIVALVEGALLALINMLVSWAISLYAARSGEQYLLPDDQEPPSRRQLLNKLPTQTQSIPWNMTGQLPMQMALLQSGNYVPQNMYNQMLLNPIGSTTFKTPGQSFPYPTDTPFTPLHQNAYSPAQSRQSQAQQQQQQQLQQQQQQSLEHQAATQGNLFQSSKKTTNSSTLTGVVAGSEGIPGATGVQVNLQGIKPTRRIGSNESTGSTYYQQVMKNKGDVKSISQYGELMRHKKTVKQNK